MMTFELKSFSRGGHYCRNNCGAIILLSIALAPQLFLNSRADAASILAILSSIQIRLQMIVFQSNVIKV